MNSLLQRAFVLAVTAPAGPHLIAAAEPPPTPATPSAAAPGPVQLPTVEVAGRQDAISNAIDRKVYNVGTDIQSATGSASDLLQNVPSVQVDVEGNVSLRGDSGVEVLINGKPSTMMGRNRAAVLAQMPAGDIERIEVITNPSAKFRPDGTGGIINLVLKRARDPGYAASVRLNAGNDDRYNAATNASFNPGRYTVYGSASIRRDSRPRIGLEDRLRYDPAGGLLGVTRQESVERARPLSRVGQLGFDFKPDDHAKVGASVQYNDRDQTRRVRQRTQVRNAAGVVAQDYDRHRHGPESEDEIEFTFTFERTFPAQEERELTGELRFGRARERQDNAFANFFRVPAASSTADATRLRVREKDADLSLDYTHPLADDGKLELGYEGEREETDTDFRASVFDPQRAEWAVDGRSTNRFGYASTLHAVYATYGRPFGKFGILAGLRLEHASVTTRQHTTHVSHRNTYARLYPSLHLSHQVTAAQKIQLSYSHRVNRPDGDELNPFPEYDDPFNLRAGNPNLVPEDTHSLEAGYQFERNDATYLASLYFRQRYHGFADVTRYVDANTLLTTKENLATSRSGGLELGATTRIKERLALNFSGNLYQQQIDAANLGFAGRRSALAWDAKLNASWDATSALLLQVTTGYTARRLTAQGERHPAHVTNAGLRYDLKGKRTSLVLTVSDVFATLKDRTTIDTPLLRGEVTRRRSGRIVYVGVIHHFGKPAKKQKEEGLKFDDSL